MQRLPYLSDPKLIPRVQKYLEANVDKTYIDIGLMADELQNTYREYSRRKRSAFRASVKKAYSIVLRSYGLDDQSDDTSEEKMDEDAENENSKDDHYHNNIMNNQLVELYTRSSSNAPKINENELIDISSDDSKEEGRVPLAKSSNGPSTSSRPTRIDFSNNFQENMEKISALQGKKRKLEERTLVQVNKKKKMEVPATAEVPQINLLENVVGIDSIVNQLVEDLLTFKFPHVYLHSDKVKPPRGFLLHGLSGCGKTFIATAIAGHLGFPFIKVCASELASGISGDTEKLIRELFKRAVSSAPCVLFFDNFHALMNDQSNSQHPKMKNSVVAEICHCIDELDKNPAADRVILIAATTNLDCVDTSLRADGRFSEEIRIGVPKEESRIAILKTLTSSFKLAPGFDWSRIASETPGYVGADLKKLVKSTWKNAFVKMVRNKLANSRNAEVYNEAPEECIEKKDSNKSETEIIVDDDSKETTDKDKLDSSQDDNLVLVIEDENSKQEEEDISSSTVPAETNNSGDAVKVTETPMEHDVESKPQESTVAPDSTRSIRILEETGTLKNLEQLVITENDFLQAAKQIIPLAIKQGLCTVPKVCWNDIGSLQNLRNELKRMLLEPIKRKKAYEEFGIDVPAGVLLCGPPGCGKTLLAKALANEANLNFFSVKGSEVINMYVGESEKAVRKCFEKAKNAAPSLIFFDELDALCPRRKASGESDVISRIVNEMLIEMDGVEDRDGVFLLAATNRPDIIDNAVLRPGRLDKILYVGIPTAEDRVDILRAITKNGTRPKLGPDVDLEIIGRLDELSRYTGADLSALVKEASRLCIDRTAIGEEWILNSEDFHKAISKIRPSITEEDKQHYDKMKERYDNGAT